MKGWESPVGSLIIAVALALALVSVITLTINGQPPIPMLPYGIVYINGEPAEDGTLVEAKIGGEVVASGYTYTEDGEKGHYSLSVEGETGDMVHFFVLGIEAEESPKSWIEGAYHLDLHIGRPYLVVGTTAPEAVAVNAPFEISAIVSNTGEADAIGVTLTLSVTGGASILGGVERIIGDLDAGATSNAVTWTLHCESLEPAMAEVQPAGIEASTGSPIPEDNLIPDEATILQKFMIRLFPIFKNYTP